MACWIAINYGVVICVSISIPCLRSLFLRNHRIRLSEPAEGGVIPAGVVEHQAEALGGAAGGGVVHVPKGDAIGVLSRVGVVRGGGASLVAHLFPSLILYQTYIDLPSILYPSYIEPISPAQVSLHAGLVLVRHPSRKNNLREGCEIRYGIARWKVRCRKTAICARLTEASGQKSPPPQPPVTPSVASCLIHAAAQ